MPEWADRYKNQKAANFKQEPARRAGSTSEETSPSGDGRAHRS